jgi:hypothetical protein
VAANGMKKKTKYANRFLAFSKVSAVGAVLAAIMLTSCARVSVHQQRLVSKPNMTFSDTLVFSYQSKLQPQIEPGSALSGGAQAAGCTSCK